MEIVIGSKATKLIPLGDCFYFRDNIYSKSTVDHSMITEQLSAIVIWRFQLELNVNLNELHGPTI